MATATKPRKSTKPAAKTGHRFLMCPPDFFSVEYVINPWMEGNVARSANASARKQWKALHEAIAARANVETITPQRGIPDLVFTANAALVLGNTAIISHFRHAERQREEPFFKEWFEKHGFETIEMPRGMFFEGAGDALFVRENGPLFLGYGWRTVLDAAGLVAERLGVEVVPLRLVDERFYHLDTCFCPLTGGRLIYFPAAFDERSVRLIESHVPAARRHAVSEKDALAFACNAVDTGSAVVLNSATPELEKVLRGWGFDVVQTPLDQFMLAGGSAKCLTLRLNEELPAAKRSSGSVAPITSRIVEFSGHIIDDGTLPRVMDLIPASGGTFHVLHFNPGLRKDDPTQIAMEVKATSAAHLDSILLQLLALGGQQRVDEETAARLESVTKAGVAPETFYSTTIYPTDVFFGGKWLRVKRQRMDAAVVLDAKVNPPTATCRLIRDLKRGEKVVTGSEGIRIHVKKDNHEDAGEFKFMGSPVSSERHVEAVVDLLAWDMKRIRDRGGRIVWVAGPVVIHTGGGPHFARLVRSGYVSALLGGNAIAVHDLEYAIYGTSLGVDLRRAVPVGGGHRHHINVINMVRGCGSIGKAVESGLIKSGLFHDIVKAKVPFSLAGSIRDDGPLPDTEMDLLKAQAEYSRLLVGADMIIMPSSMLHSIGVGNMTPAGVRMICVDINPAMAAKLADRGSTDATSIVTDVGLFLNILARKLAEE